MSSQYRRIRSIIYAMLAFVVLLPAAALHAENDGQDDLDQAYDKKLGAKNLDDLAQVVDLCESALKKGLDAANTKSANSLLTGVLMERASVLTRAIVGQDLKNWPQVRASALADLEKAIKIDPNLATAQLMIARLQALPGGNHAAALKAAEAAYELSKDNTEQKVAALVLRADLTEDAEKKLDLFTQALKIAPRNEEALRQRGLFYYVTGKFEEAATDLDAAAAADPENPEIQEIRGLTLMRLKRNDDAIRAFSELIKLVPDSPLAYFQRATAYAQDKKTQEALDDIDQTLKKDTDKLIAVKALWLRARVHQLAGDTKAARADLDEALKDRPGEVNALELRGVISAGEGDYRQAIEDFEGLRKIAPKNPDLLAQLGLLYEANKQPRKAIENYSDALAIVPDNYLALRGRADAYLNVGKHSQAVSDYDAAMKLKADDSNMLNNFAWVLATSPDEGVRNGKRAVELGIEAAKLTEYKKPHILSTLAASYAESGDFDKARQWSQKAVQLGQDDPELDADTKTQLKKELASYEEKKPWREKQILEEKDESQQKSDDQSSGRSSSADSANSSATKDASTKKK